MLDGGPYICFLLHKYKSVSKLKASIFILELLHAFGFKNKKFIIYLEEALCVYNTFV